MKVLVTGTGGFLGRNFVTYLSQKQSLELASLSRSPCFNLKSYIFDLRSMKKSVFECLKDFSPDIIFHLSGCVSRDLEEMSLVNNVYSSVIMQVCNELELNTKLVVMGSAAEYGFVKSDQLPVTESHTLNPINHYGVTKLTQSLASQIWSKGNSRAIVFRPFTLIGKGMPTHLALGNFENQIKMILKGKQKPVIEVGNLLTQRDFIDIQDACRLIWESALLDTAYGEVFNLCSGQATKVRDILDFMITQSAMDIKIRLNDAFVKPIDMSKHYGCNSKLKNILGPLNLKPWQESLRDLYE